MTMHTTQFSYLIENYSIDQLYNWFLEKPKVAQFAIFDLHKNIYNAWPEYIADSILEKLDKVMYRIEVLFDSDDFQLEHWLGVDTDGEHIMTDQYFLIQGLIKNYKLTNYYV